MSYKSGFGLSVSLFEISCYADFKSITEKYLHPFKLSNKSSDCGIEQLVTIASASIHIHTDPSFFNIETIRAEYGLFDF